MDMSLPPVTHTQKTTYCNVTVDLMEKAYILKKE